MIWVSFALLAGLIFVLVKSSDYFIDAVVRLAKYIGVSDFVIGLTVVSIGTTLPELGASTMAVLAGETDLATGNFLGSVIANTGLVLGLSTMLIAVKTNRRIFMKDGIILIAIALIFSALCLDGEINQMEGIFLISIMPIYLAYLFNFKPHMRRRAFNFKKYLQRVYRIEEVVPGEKIPEKALKDEKYEDFVGKGFDLEAYKNVKTRLVAFKKDLLKQVAIIIASAGAIYISAHFLVPTAVDIATFFGVGESIIGATLIAVGTSLPELSVSITSLRKGFGNIMLGNIIGANIFNMTLVAGLSASIMTLPVSTKTLTFIIPFMLIMLSTLLIFIRTNWKIEKFEGAALFILYAIFIYLLVWGT